MDYGERYADKKISTVNRELRKTYRTAQAELKKKLSDFEKRFAAKNKQKKLELEAGKISKQDYKDWLTGQVFIRTQFEQNIKKVNAVLLDCNRQALNIINNARFDVFAENYNYNAWKAEREIAVSFNVYSAESVARLMLDDPQLLPEWKIDEKKDYIWNYNKVNNIVRQGIIQGEGVPEITERLCNGLASSNESKMRMFARTAINSAQNAGRQKQMEDAAAMGIDVAKRWIATRDSRTRDAHRDLDGKEVPFDKPFKSQLGDIMFPGDPTAPAANVFNCRCTMVTIYPKYEDRSKQWGEGDTVEGVPYEVWKEGKRKQGEVQPGEPNPGEPSQLEKKVNAQVNKKPHELTNAESRAVEDYVSGDMMFINQILRGRAGELTEDDKEFVKLMDSALADPIGKEQTLFRSVDAEAIFGKMSDGDYQNLNTYLLYGKDSFGKGNYADSIRSQVENIIRRADGSTITEKGYMSTTKDKELAYDWGGFTGSEKPVVIELKTPPETRGRDLKDFDVESDEQQEVLLARNQKYKILGIRGENGSIVISAEIVTEKGDKK